MKKITEIERVVRNSEHVAINHAKLRDIAREINSSGISHWMEKCPVDLSQFNQEEIIAFLFTFNAVSFCYWARDDNKWSSGYERGTFSMINSLKRAIDKGKSILNPDYLANLRQKDLEEILQGNTTIPLFQERLEILRELGQNIRSYTDFIEGCNYDALVFVEKLTEEVPSFRDSSEYKGEKITFSKRAQLLASDLGQILKFRNLDQLTACADYILPMVLRHSGVLIYSSELSKMVDNRIEIPRGSEYEVEIRANTIGAVRLISKIKGITDMQVNDFLWIAGDSVPEDKYYHRTRTTAY